MILHISLKTIFEKKESNQKQQRIAGVKQKLKDFNIAFEFIDSQGDKALFLDEEKGLLAVVENNLSDLRIHNVKNLKEIGVDEKYGLFLDVKFSTDNNGIKSYYVCFLNDLKKVSEDSREFYKDRVYKWKNKLYKLNKELKFEVKDSPYKNQLIKSNEDKLKGNTSYKETKTKENERLSIRRMKGQLQLELDKTYKCYQIKKQTLKRYMFILDHLNQIKCHPTVKKLILGFIREHGTGIFTKIQYSIEFEKYLLEKDSIYHKFLDSSSVNIESYRNEYLFLMINVNNFFDDTFKKFLIIVNKYLDLDIKLNDLEVIMWVILRETAYSKIAEEFDKLFNLKTDDGLENTIRYFVRHEFFGFNYLESFNIFLVVNWLVDERNIYKSYKVIKEKVTQEHEQYKTEQYEKRLLNPNPDIKETIQNISQIDEMSGEEFENYIEELLIKMGYSTRKTKGSSDQGIDIIATKGNLRLGVQTKRYTNKVSNKAVQEVVAGISYYNLDKGLVITNSSFTKPAQELAVSNDVILWDRSNLIMKIKQFINPKFDVS